LATRPTSRAVSRRTLFDWHSWIGLTAGLLLFVICWSGTVAVFSRELDRMTDPQISAPPAPTVAWRAIFQSAQARYPDWVITQINAPLKPGYAAETWAEDTDGVLRRIYSDPASGAVIGTTSYFNLQRFFRSLHMSLFIGELPVWGIPLGYLVVGLFSIPLLASAVTALLFYRRFWRGFLKLQTHRGSKVFWSDVHKLVGLWSLWFVLVIGVTGVWYLVEWKTPEGPSSPAASSQAGRQRPLEIKELVLAAQRAYPELQIKTLATYEMKQGLFEVQGQDGSALVRHRAAKAWVDAHSGKVLGVQRPAELSAYDRWIDTADPLHFGDFGGMWSKIIWFVFGLGLSGLSLTGAYLQVQRQNRRPVSGYRAPVIAAYAITVAIVIMSVLYGAKEALSYGPDGSWPTMTPWQLGFITIWTFTTLAALSFWMWKVR
jgi:uncharacterized iron-regulated membrane protein